MQHGSDYDGSNLSGWVATEKFNGCRVYWDGYKLWSRGGIDIKVPDELFNLLPIGVHLDCELYDGVGGVYRCGAAIRYGNFNKTMKLIVFDAPLIAGTYIERLKELEKYENEFIECVKYSVINNSEDVNHLLCEIFSHNGEGLMVRDNTLEYAPGRTNKLLKIKALL